jgi:hypothetical protein
VDCTDLLVSRRDKLLGLRWFRLRDRISNTPKISTDLVNFDQGQRLKPAIKTGK